MTRSGPARRLTLFLLIALTGMLLPATTAAQSELAPPWRTGLVAPPTEVSITVGSTPLKVQLALTPDQQTLGLGYRNGLAPGTGMLFVFDAPSVQTFWMKGMRFCLDIVWVTETELAGAAENVCPDPSGTPDADRPIETPSQPVQYVLEVPAGWLAAHGYGAGTPVNLSTLPAATPVAATPAPQR